MSVYIDRERVRKVIVEFAQEQIDKSRYKIDVVDGTVELSRRIYELKGIEVKKK